MQPSNPSCVVALSTERNCATAISGATGWATESEHIPQKPLSIQQLRAQLRAQLSRNESASKETANPAPIVGAGDTVTATMTADDEKAIRAWLALIEETDTATIADVLNKCQADPDARDYFTRRAAAELPKPDPFPDDRRRCTDCLNLRQGVCSIAKPEAGALVMKPIIEGRARERMLAGKADPTLNSAEGIETREVVANKPEPGALVVASRGYRPVNLPPRFPRMFTLPLATSLP